jgi:hypothetical protein
VLAQVRLDERAQLLLHVDDLDGERAVAEGRPVTAISQHYAVEAVDACTSDGVDEPPLDPRERRCGRSG